MIIKLKTMDLNQNYLKLLVEQIIDFDSFSQNGYYLWSFFRVQEWSPIFDMLNGPTYPHLVKDFWARVEVFDELATCEELKLLVEMDNSLKEKTRKEVDLEKFEEFEIRYVVMGVDVIITQKTFAILLCSPNSGRFVVGTEDNSPEVDVIKWCLFDDAENLCSS